MIADKRRTAAYAEALRRVVRPGSVVADIGSGTGVFAIIAARLGARRVFAIERDEVIEVARQIARDNAVDAIVEFIQSESMTVNLPERADVIVSDLHGNLPYHGMLLAAMADARHRFLKPGGVMVPSAETLWMCCVEAPDLHRAITDPWSSNAAAIDMTAASRLLAHRWRPARMQARQCVGAPQCWTRIDYASVNETDTSAFIELNADRDATAHGLCAWFDMTLAPGIEISNAPSADPLVYGSTFFPWPEAVELKRGDAVAVQIAGKLVAGQYVWTWNTRIRSGRAREIVFTQSDLLSVPLSASRLRRRASTFVASPNENADVDRLALDLIAQRRALGDVAHELVLRYPARFSRWEQALAHVGELAERYSL